MMIIEIDIECRSKSHAFLLGILDHLVVHQCVSLAPAVGIQVMVSDLLVHHAGEVRASKGQGKESQKHRKRLHNLKVFYGFIRYTNKKYSY